MTDPSRLSARELAARIAARELSPVEVAQATIAAIERLNPRLHAFLDFGGERLLADARAAEQRVMRGEALPPLLGVPIAIKDMETTEEFATTRGSLAFRGHHDGVDAVHVARLRAAGALIVGKTNTPEFALLGETRNRLGPDCCNPWDVSRTPGGSSGGSAAAVAAGIVPLATGTDTGGSITIPAAFCGTFGFKPTHRRIPVWPNADEWPLVYDTGPITRTVDDAALALSLMAGEDTRDPASVRAPAPLAQTEPRALRIAFATTLADLPVEAECRAAVRTLAGRCSELGHYVEEDGPECATPAAALGTMGCVEEYLYRGHLLAKRRDELDTDTITFMERGRRVDALAFARAMAEVRATRTAFDRFFERYDLLLTPATACPAFPRNEPPHQIESKSVAPGWTTFAPFSLFANATDSPLASVPAPPATDGSGLPLGVLIFGPVGADERVLALSRALEAASPWQQRQPPLHAAEHA